jgi:replicative DNA helicase
MAGIQRRNSAQLNSQNRSPANLAALAKVPPQNIEAEQSLLGALLIDKEAILNIAEMLTPDHFYRVEQHGQIYNAIIQLFEKREPIDLVTVTERLKSNGVLDKIGGPAYLAELINMVPTAAHVESYARIIKDHAMRRYLIANATRFVEIGYDESREVHDIVEECEQSIFAISQNNLKRDFIQLKDAIAQSFDRLDELSKTSGKMRGVPTGFKDLDNKLAGLQDSNLIIFAARPGMGKTSFVLNLAQHAAVNEGLPVGIFSLEMSQEELVDRLLVAQADIDAWKLKTGRLDEKDYDKLSHAMGQLAEAPIFIDDTPGITISELRTKARRLQMEHGLKLIVVDYLQLIHGRNIENRVQEVTEISQALKNLARELKVPVLSCAQLSRAVENRGGVKKPQLSDLRESGGIEQDADVVMFLYREDDSQREYMKIAIEKHRNGSTGEIDLVFKGDRMKFYGMEKLRRSGIPPKSDIPPIPPAAA